MSIELTYINDEGEEIELTLPAKREVCPTCDGDGSVLCEGMRGYAYSAEEFYESFDPEEAEEYFKPHGRYDVTCETCHGRNVIDAVDEEHLSQEQKVQYEKYLEYQDREARYRAEERATTRAENGYRD